MTQIATGFAEQFQPYEFEPTAVVEQAQLPLADAYPRPKWLPLLFLFPVAATGVSWLNGGMPMLTDLGFLLLTILCATFLVVELSLFARRWGLGGCVGFGGVLVWFCYDYMTNWFGHDFSSVGTDVRAEVIAKAAFMHVLFIFMMTVCLTLRGGKWMGKLLRRIPDPATEQFYLVIVLCTFFLGIIPLAFFTSESFFTSVYRAIFAGRGSGGVMWTTGRTGNLNYSWGGYLAQLVEVGSFGGLFAAYYAMMVAKSSIKKLIAWADWAFWAAMGFGTGARGELLYVALPVLLLVYLKYQSKAAETGRKFSIRAYAYSAMIALGLLFLVQIQIVFRNEGFYDVNISSAASDLKSIKGNMMFSEGLDGFAAIPDSRPFFHDSIPGETIVRPYPEAVFWFVIGPMPRALWTSKPIDPGWAWRTQGRLTSDDNQGTTISSGEVGYWYFRYGIFGVIEGGLLFGYLLRTGERALQSAEGKTFSILLSLGFLTYMFRMFRDFEYHDLYPLIIGAIVIYVLIRIELLFFGSRTE